MIFSKNLDIFKNNTSNSNFKKLEYVSYILRDKIYFLIIRSTLNNFYITITNNFGKIIFLKSGGMLDIISSKRNASYTLELLLFDLLKKAAVLNINYFILRLDFQLVKKKKVIIKVLQKFQIKVLGVQLKALKVFNGVRLKKKRRL